MTARGRLLAFEGIDGCGKSTQARALADALGARLTREPGGTPLGATLRQILLAPDAPEVSLRAEALLMAADRAEHVAEVIEPALASGQWVVSDRFSASTLAYQGYGRGLEIPELSELVRWATGGLVADLSILVDVPVEVAATRLASSAPDRLERLGTDFAARVREGFLALAAADPGHWVVTDGTMDEVSLSAHIVTFVQDRLGDAMSEASLAVTPAAMLFDAVIGQDAAVAALKAAAVRPVHAYLFVGPSGHGGLAAAHGFAAALLCRQGGCGNCATCAGVLAGRDPDLHLIRRSGAALSVEDARRVVAVAQRRPLQSARQVVVVADAHLCERAAPALLKTLEEPPGQTVFILLADHLNPDLVTVASRCVQVAFPPVERGVLEEWLAGRGVPDDVASVIADSCGGSPGRAQVMIDDPEVAARAALWASVPDRLDGNGALASDLVLRLIESTDHATEPLRSEHARQLESMTTEAKEMGERSLPGRKEILDQQQREERRWRTDALRAGLGVLARSYRSRAVGEGGGALGGPDVRGAIEAVALITAAAQALPRNPNEALLLQSLLVRLGALAA